MAMQDRLDWGETADQAKNSALRGFGNVGLIKEVTRDMWRLVSLLACYVPARRATKVDQLIALRYE